MPLFRRTDPGPRPLIAYIVAAARARGITLNRTKLVKLLYLIDIERVRSRREPLTGFEWVFFHYGPYTFELIELLDAMEGSDLVTGRWHNSVLYRDAPGAPDGDEWPPATKNMIDHVVADYGPLDLNPLLDYVYFHTGPMIGAHRGQRLDLSQARGDQPRHHRPLTAHSPPTDVDERLAQWRSRNARRLPPVRLDPPASFLTDAEDAEVPAASGRMHVPDDTDL